MRTAKKTSIILAGFLIIGGLALTSAGFAMLRGDNSMALMQNTYIMEENFENIYIDAAEADVQFAPAPKNECHVDCAEGDNVYHTVEVENNTLTVKRIDNRKWYEHVGIFVFQENMKITVYLPESEYDKLYIRTSSGDIDISGQYSFNDAEVYGTSGDITLTSVEATSSMTVKATSGHLSLSDITCGGLITDTTSGDTVLTNADAGNIEGKSTSGDIELRHCDAGTLKIKTSSGNVKASLKSDKIFTTETTSGSINVPGTTAGGICKITTVSGDINAKIDN